jgi:hypothetical protein
MGFVGRRKYLRLIYAGYILADINKVDPGFYNFYFTIYFTDATVYTQFSIITDISVTSQHTNMAQIKLTQTQFSYSHSIPYKSHQQGPYYNLSQTQ